MSFYSFCSLSVFVLMFGDYPGPVVTRVGLSKNPFISTIDVACSPKGKESRQTSISSSLTSTSCPHNFGFLEITFGCDYETHASSVVCMAKATTSRGCSHKYIGMYINNCRNLITQSERRRI